MPLQEWLKVDECKGMWGFVEKLIVYLTYTMIVIT